VVVLYEDRIRSGEAVRRAAREAVARQVPLTVLHVLDRDTMACTEGRQGLLHWWPDEVIARGRQAAAEGAEIARDAVPDVVAHPHLRLGSPRRCLIEAIQQAMPDVIALPPARAARELVGTGPGRA